MSRSAYSDDIDDNWGWIRWRGAVASSIKGARGQALLRDLLAALDAMPDKRLWPGELVQPDGGCCALGALGLARGMEGLDKIDSEDTETVAKLFGVADPLVREIVHVNDESDIRDYRWIRVEVEGPMRPGFPDWGAHERTVRVPDPGGPARRWAEVRAWVASQILPEKAAA